MRSSQIAASSGRCVDSVSYLAGNGRTSRRHVSQPSRLANNEQCGGARLSDFVEGGESYVKESWRKGN